MRSRLLTRASKRSSSKQPTETKQESPSSPKRGSTYGNSLKKASSIHGIYTSTKTGKVELYDSTFELRRFRALDASPLVKTWTKDHKLKLPYKLKHRRHRYIPDIVVEYHDGRKFLEEVKGYVYEPKKFIMKNASAKVYCSLKKWTYRIIWEDDLDTVL